MFSSLASKSGAMRYYIFAGWSLLSGIVLSVLEFDAVETGTLLYFAVMGGLLIPFGMVQFVMFLRKHPKAAKEVWNGIFTRYQKNKAGFVSCHSSGWPVRYLRRINARHHGDFFSGFSICRSADRWLCDANDNAADLQEENYVSAHGLC